MLHGHKYKVTIFLLYYFPLVYILLLGKSIQVVKASSSGSSSSRNLNNYERSVQEGDNFGGRGGGLSGKLDASASSKDSEDSLRREFIKVQILQRLGLNEKPHVDMAHKISKDLVLETLRRTENFNDYNELASPTDTTSPPGSSAANNNERHVASLSLANNSTTAVDEEGVANYAKTSEIISFPDKGPVLNGHNLLTFLYAGSQAYGVGVRVKKAHLWVKLDYRSSIGRHFGHLLAPKGITLYVFQVHGNFSTQSIHSQQTIHLNNQDVDLELVVKRTIPLDSLGWQKLDVTSVVQKWYGKQSRHRIRHANRHNNHRDKLTLLVDCSGCGYCIQPIIFSRENGGLSTNADEAIDNGNNSEGDSIDSQGGGVATRRLQNSLNENSNSNSFWASSSAFHVKRKNEAELLPSSKHHHNKGRDPDNENEKINENFYESSILNLNRGETVTKVDNFTEMPFLVIETESAPNFKRSRRRALECSPRVKHCCKQRFYISFKDLDWDDWIIAPRGYYANYCRGSCGGPHRTPDTFLNYHTHVLEEYRRTPEGQVNLSGITPCCAPTKLAPMSLIYFGPDLNIIKRDLPKMIVEECGCP